VALCVTLQNLIKIGQAVAEIWRFNGFYQMAPSAILDLSDSKILTVAAVKMPILHHRTKFRKHWSNVAETSRF